MADIVSRSMPPDRRVRLDRENWLLIIGVAATLLAVTYLAAALHARHPIGSGAGAVSHSIWLPLQLFVIATSPALAGFIFLWSERHLQSGANKRLIRNLGIFGFGLVLAAWAAFAPK